ncbi:MAG: hypothetical protein EP343_16555 [Deltaproteobacteria bacterium]|nr:MAG: hypothetical protein EP343_16555 [Deltaproteobacteria bacterium]
MGGASELQTNSSVLLHLAVREGMLTPQQATECILACGQAIYSDESFALDQFFKNKGWLTGEQLSFLEKRKAELDGSTIDSFAFVSDLQATMESVDPTTTVEKTLSANPLLPDVAELLEPTGDGETLHAGEGLSHTPDSLSLAAGVWVKIPEDGRYRKGDVLGQGGLGIVVEAEDRVLGRKVASKSLLHGKNASPQIMASFLQEARVTGFLEHPNIMPIYDMGEEKDGTPFYTMRLLPPKDLSDILKEGDTSLMQLVRILQQVCMGLEYAHSQGVVHRDIKPANILLGQFGEVVIADWGVAKVLSHEWVGTSPEGLLPSGTGRLKGTPAFMAPEQIKEGLISPFVDQYAVGVMLYQILTGALPFFDDNVYTVLFQICSMEPVRPSQRAPERVIPEELEDICLTMLAKSPHERYSSCREVYEKLEEFLEGTQDRERRHQAAMVRVQSASTFADQYHILRNDIGSLQSDWEEASRKIDSWAPVEEKHAMWAKEEAYQSAQREAERLFGNAIQAFTQALEHEPGNPDARAGLASLYWSRFAEAEAKQDALGQIYYGELVRLYDDGRYAVLLDGAGGLDFRVVNAEATVDIYKLEEKDRRLAPTLLKSGLASPFVQELAMGSYLLEVVAEGYRKLHFPVLMERCDRVSVEVELHPEDSIGQEFVYIPGCEASQGDPDAPMGLPVQTVKVESFLIGRHPITMGEYLAFVNDIHQHDPVLARSMLPRSGEELYAQLDVGTQTYVPLRETLFHGPITELYPEEGLHEWDLPVIGVSWFDSIRYCRWRTEKEGRLFLLPTEQQWELAARGVDRRIYPWGNKFEATYCKMGRSRPPEFLQPEPIGAFPQDSSVFGMMDVVGTVGEWMLSLAMEDVSQLQEPPDETVIFRGGGWIASNKDSLRIGSRVPKPAQATSYNCGFRVVTFPKVDA